MIGTLGPIDLREEEEEQVEEEEDQEDSYEVEKQISRGRRQQDGGLIQFIIYPVRIIYHL